tara:strand:- start:246 stop:743 length:498 start_codon:yes stop_codon:yes gene_type:complete
MKYILLFGFLATGIAQNYNWDDEKDRDRRNPEKMENMIIWRLTNDLDLSTDQAEKFFPRFREHRKNLESVGKQEREMVENIDREKLNKNDVKITIEKISKLRQKRIKLESEFVLSLDDILSPDQMIKLGVFKQRMMMEMRGEIREGKGKKKRHKKKARKRGRRGF